MIWPFRRPSKTQSNHVSQKKSFHRKPIHSPMNISRKYYMVLSWNMGTPSHHPFRTMGFSIINHPAIGVPPFSELETPRWYFKPLHLGVVRGSPSPQPGWATPGYHLHQCLWPPAGASFILGSWIVQKSRVDRCRLLSWMEWLNDHQWIDWRRNSRGLSVFFRSGNPKWPLNMQHL